MWKLFNIIIGFVVFLILELIYHFTSIQFENLIIYLLYAFGIFAILSIGYNSFNFTHSKESKNENWEMKEKGWRGQKAWIAVALVAAAVLIPFLVGEYIKSDDVKISVCHCELECHHQLETIISPLCGLCLVPNRKSF